MSVTQPNPQLRSNALCIAEALIARPSITPDDAGCQHFLRTRLERLGFNCITLEVNGVTNLIARIGNGERHIAFNGHTDVVPPGDLNRWNTDPFTPVLHAGRLYGRGAADMKTGLAAMLAACEAFDWRSLASELSFWWLITSDEEGEAEHGSLAIQQYLQSQGVELSSVLIAEPTAATQAGDCIKVGRRGSLSARVNIQGRQGHVAYPKQTINAALQGAKIAMALSEIEFAPGSVDFPGTTLQVTQIDSGTHVDNLVPGRASVAFNVRYASDFNETSLKALLTDAISTVGADVDVQWERLCEAYLSNPTGGENCLINIAEAAIFEHSGRFPVLSTAGGTSDGRFFATEGTQVIEIGVSNRTIHQANESIAIDDLEQLTAIFIRILPQWLGR
ncbi:succinyl-diaminopimelate desuccinylase [Alteromonas sp. ASW11-36]|uniref:Succinyl-diaminopimelate desuccinylase n=1 Tax=Alteromonas arenosi TaxID=3055817 RepID=A0ABT7SUP7_9ALTE|nr:succinyl-diaminopimelate desuccinylase [Alteromonas sp. ASW11-36]MDM7859729.1 succinyl-diaminopimelate desuccinylase [Alteromonas sp. ASW11-36]